MKLETLIAERLAQLTDNNFEAVHTAGGALTESQRRIFEMNDPTDEWLGPDMAEFAAEDIAYNAEANNSIGTISDMDNAELCELIDDEIMAVATEMFVAWCGEQEWWGRCPARTLSDVCVHLVGVPEFDISVIRKNETGKVQSVTLTKASKDLLREISEEHFNMGGFTVSGLTREQKGNLTDLKVKGLVTPTNDEGWLNLTGDGENLAEELFGIGYFA